jgi:hypothetical protein
MEQAWEPMNAVSESVPGWRKGREPHASRSGSQISQENDADDALAQANSTEQLMTRLLQ